MTTPKHCHPELVSGSCQLIKNEKTILRIYTNQQKNHVLYVGVTNNIDRRVAEHKQGKIKGFTQKYKINKIVYVEDCGSINDTIAREKQIKNWHRSWKINLIEKDNPQWKDLSENK